MYLFCLREAFFISLQVSLGIHGLSSRCLYITVPNDRTFLPIFQYASIGKVGLDLIEKFFDTSKQYQKLTLETEH